MNGVRNISNHVIRLSFFALLLIISVAIIYSIKMLAIPLIASVLIAFLLQPFVNFFEARNINRLLVIIIIYALMAAVVVAGGLIVIPRLLFEGREFAKDFPSMRQQSEMLSKICANLF